MHAPLPLPLQVTRLQEEVLARDEQVADVRQLSTGGCAASLFWGGGELGVFEVVWADGPVRKTTLARVRILLSISSSSKMVSVCVCFRQSNITIPGPEAYQLISSMNLGAGVSPQGMGPPWCHQDLTEQLTDLQLQVARLQQVWTAVTDAEMSEAR